MNLIDMAKAHLGNVQAALSDLLKQREKLDQEIQKLSFYLKEGESLVLDHEHVNSMDSSVSNVDN